MTKNRARRNEGSEWVSLRHAADILGVHPATVRNWADNGKLPFRRTAGNHRRFNVNDLSGYVGAQGDLEPIELQIIMQSALGQTAHASRQRELGVQPLGNAAMSDQSKHQLRDQGPARPRSYAQFVAAGAPDSGLATAITLGKDYATRLIADGLTLPQAMRGFYFFSDFVLESIMTWSELRQPSSSSEWSTLLRQVNAFMHAMQLSIVEYYEETDASADVLWVALRLSPHIGAKTFGSLLRHFDQDLAAVLAAPQAELLRVKGVGQTIARDIIAIDLSKVAEQMESWRASGVAILTTHDQDYPAPLRELDQAPPLIFALGELGADLWTKTLAIVGTRIPTKEARYITLQLASKLSRSDYTVVSGLALGIDTAGHTGALSAQGRTVAVLGSGVLNIYPESNRKLAGHILERGALISELHPRWGANAQRLVSRNRIISGLSQAVILVESNADGGAMYTARFAREQGRPVYTFDLPSSGNQALIKNGAVVLNRDDPLGFPLQFLACGSGLV